jgi:alkylation response protein AidB-like acyl-CoA dehydrogenase
MDLNYTPDDVAFRKQVRAWLEHNLPAAPLRSLAERKIWHRKIYEAGYLGMGWPKEYGGQGARPMEQAIVADEMARSGAPSPTNGLGLGIVGPTIVVHGNEWQKKRYLQKILTAEEMWCQLYSEPNSGSDLASLKTSAEDTGDHFTVNGQKIWTSGGKVADWGLLLARTDPKVAKHKGISCFLMSMRQPGVEVRPLKQMTGSSEFCEVFMTGARVEKENQIGRLGEGWAIANTTLGYERGGRSLARISGYASQYHHLVAAARRLKRHGKALIESPLIRQKLGKIWADLEVERYNALRILTQLEKGEHPGAGGSLTKLSYSEFEKRFMEVAQEILGAYGQLTDGAPPELALEIDTAVGDQGTWAYAFLWSRAGTIYAGSSEIQKNVIGERILGLPKETRADRAGAAR